VALPSNEIDALNRRGLAFSVREEAGMTCVVIANYPLPPGFSVSHADLLMRLNAGFPDVPPDMWWFAPPAQRIDGVVIPATDYNEMHLGRQWQRWSRHLNQGQWQCGIDGLDAFLALIQRELEKSVPELVT